MNLREIAVDIYETNKRNGFWETERNVGEITALIVSELSEALEADRKNNKGNVVSFHHDLVSGVPFADAFKIHIKDSISDELADAAIRILDTVQGIFMEMEKDMFFENCERANGSLYGTKNFGEAMTKITCYLSKSYDSQYDKARLFWLAFSGINTVCHERKIDLYFHIEQKLEFNKTREFRHGKAY